MAIAKMRHSERTAACLNHLAGIIPIWGAMVMASILWRYRGRSRPVVFHAQQALFFHLAFILVITIPMLLILAGNVIGILRPAPGQFLITFGYWSIVFIYIVNIAICLYAANRVIDGKQFEYPFFGRKLRPSFVELPKKSLRREYHTYMTPIPESLQGSVTPEPAEALEDEEGDGELEKEAFNESGTNEDVEDEPSDAVQELEVPEESEVEEEADVTSDDKDGKSKSRKKGSYARGRRQRRKSTNG